MSWTVVVLVLVNLLMTLVVGQLHAALDARIRYE